MGQICNRAGLPMPQKIPSFNKDGKEYYSMRGSLVLEESRCLLSDGLSESKHGRRNPGHNGTMGRKRDVRGGIAVELLNIQERPKRKGLVLSFRKYDLRQRLQSEVLFSSTEMQSIRHGTIFEIVPFNNRMGSLPQESHDSDPMNSNDLKESSVLAVIMPWASFNETGSGGKVSLMVFRTQGLQELMRSSSRWILYPIVSLISEQRQFIACCDAKKVLFLPKLLGIKSATHIRFDDSGEEESNIITILDSDEEESSHINDGYDQKKKDIICLVETSDSEDQLFSDDSSDDDNQILHQVPKDISNNHSISDENVGKGRHEEAPMILLVDDSSDEDVIPKKHIGNIVSQNSMISTEKRGTNTHEVEKVKDNEFENMPSAPEIDQNQHEDSSTKKNSSKDFGTISSATKLSPRKLQDDANDFVENRKDASPSQIDQPLFLKSNKEIGKDSGILPAEIVHENETKLSTQKSLDEASDATDNGKDLSKTTNSTIVKNDVPSSSQSEMNIPTLNSTQEEAAVSFLGSPNCTLSIVQGPPGKLHAGLNWSLKTCSLMFLCFKYQVLAKQRSWQRLF